MADRLDPQIASYSALIRDSGASGDLSKAERAHADVLESPHRRNRYLRNLLIEMYGSCGDVHRAREIFDALEPNLYSWNIMLKVYVQNGHREEALQLYRDMEAKNVKPGEYTYATVLGACANLDQGKQIHSKLSDEGLESLVVVGTQLINMYSRCGSLEDAREVFDRMSEKNAVSWTSMIVAYAQKGNLHEAAALFEEMPEPKDFAWNVMITAFSQHGKMQLAEQFFDRMPHKDVVTKTAMLSGYAQKGKIEEARKIFDTMDERTSVSWNAMLAAYGKAGLVEEARRFFRTMPSRDVVSWTLIISAYAQAGYMVVARGFFDQAPIRDATLWNVMLAAYSEKGKTDEARALFDQIPCKDKFSWNTMLAAYALHGHMSEAWTLFEQMPVQSTVSWNTMITSYAANGDLERAKELLDRMPDKNTASWNIMVIANAEHGQPQEALNVIVRMDLEGIQLHNVTFRSLFNACINKGGGPEDTIIHKSMLEAGVTGNTAVGDALINMYAKFGSIRDSTAVFQALLKDGLVNYTVVNGLIAAYSHAGLGKEAAELFQTSALEGIRPNEVTFVQLLSACAHAGLTADAHRYFTSIPIDYNLELSMNHYNCMDDMLARTGKLELAEELLNCMPFQPRGTSWVGLLAAARDQEDPARGIKAALKVLELQPRLSATYIVLSNILNTQLGRDALLKYDLDRDYDQPLAQKAASNLGARKTKPRKQQATGPKQGSFNRKGFSKQCSFAPNSVYQACNLRTPMQLVIF